MTRYTYKGYALINADGYCRVFRNGQFIAAWPQVNWCKMMIDAAIRNGDEATATRLYGMWQDRSAWEIREWREYQTSRQVPN